MNDFTNGAPHYPGRGRRWQERWGDEVPGLGFCVSFVSALKESPSVVQVRRGALSKGEVIKTLFLKLKSRREMTEAS